MCVVLTSPAQHTITSAPTCSDADSEVLYNRIETAALDEQENGM